MGASATSPVKKLGTRVNYLADASGVIRQAAGDTVVIFDCSLGSVILAAFYDTATPPTTQFYLATNQDVIGCFLIRKNEYWKITVSGGTLDIYTIAFEP